MSPVSRAIPGLVPGRVEMETNKIPCDCSSCCWIVFKRASRRGPALSYLKKMSALCPRMHEHQRSMAEAAAAAAEFWRAS